MMHKLDMGEVVRSADYYKWHRKPKIGSLQVAVYVMAGGGFLGRMAAEQPADFYIDDRCGRLPYKRAEIRQAVNVLEVLACKAGLDPRHMPQMPDFHSAGLW